MPKGVLSVCALFLIHVITGSGFMWGSFSSYLISYLRIYDDTLRIVDGFFCMGLVVFFINSTATLGVYLEKRFGYRKLVFLSVIMIELGYVFILISKSIYIIYISLICVGLFSGQIFVSTVRVGWKLFPEKKGLVSGIILGGLGLSPVLFNLIAQGMINPNNENPSDRVGDDVFYSKEISENVPNFFITLIIVIASLHIVSLILIQIDGKIDNMKSEGFEEKLVIDHASDSYKNVQEPLSKALKSKVYIMNLIMGMLESFFFYTIYNVCKPFGLIQEIDEKLLFILTNIFAFINGSSRMLFGYLYDRLGFKILYRIFLIVTASATIYFLSKNSALYFVICCLSALCMGGGFAVFPSHLINVFGMKNGSELYAIVTIAFGVSNLASPTIAKFVVKSSNDYIILFTICAVLAFISLIICQFIVTEDKFDYKDNSESLDNTKEENI